MIIKATCTYNKDTDRIEIITSTDKGTESALYLSNNVLKDKRYLCDVLQKLCNDLLKYQ